MAEPDPGPDRSRQHAGFADVVLEFVQGLEQRVQSMHTALDASDLDALRVAARQLRDCGGGYGYPALSERASELEACCREGARDACRRVLDDLTRICIRMMATADARKRQSS